MVFGPFSLAAQRYNYKTRRWSIDGGGRGGLHQVSALTLSTSCICLQANIVSNMNIDPSPKKVKEVDI